MTEMEGETGLVNRCSRKEKKRPYNYFLMGLQETDSDVEERSTERPCKDPNCSFNRMGQQTGHSVSETELCGAEFSVFPPACPVCAPQHRLGESGDDEDSHSAMLDYSVYLNEQHNMVDCSQTRPVRPPVSPVAHRPVFFEPLPSSVTTIAPTMSSMINSLGCSSMTDTCSAISSKCSQVGSLWGPVRSAPRSPGWSNWDPVNAAAHLHLLGESLSLIGNHLQETNKTVCVSSSLSLLLDSLLCALAPLMGLTIQIPELKSCTQHTLASTLESIAYMMPGL
ncbi:uncharacterized protein hmgxb4b [Mastacembelus armatus]|uniref:uncharacterized protein hmgxb4b n=1 Tax=Mastacembelus armatus TaxID=205130 RepID=UPI000E457829|nr:uncharacterized protein LOC113127818 [Mastacembelus armatus]